VERHPGNRVRLYRGGAPRVLVLEPRPGLRRWPAALREAWDRRDEIRGAIESEDARALKVALGLLLAASEAVPEAMLVQHQLAQALVASGREADAQAALERALLGAGLDDVEYTLRCRALLAGLYAASGRREEARLQYRLILRTAERHELLDEARAFLAGRD
jgi:hypothetical protein